MAAAFHTVLHLHEFSSFAGARAPDVEQCLSAEYSVLARGAFGSGLPESSNSNRLGRSSF